MSRSDALTHGNPWFGARRWTSFLLMPLAALQIACAKRADSSRRPQEPPFVPLGAWGEKGDGPGQLDRPVAMAIDGRGRVYFADVAQGFVHKFESNGTPLLSFEDPRFRHAAGIAVDSGGAIYVLNAEMGEVIIYFPDGTFLRALRVPATPHFAGTLGIAVDMEGNLYVPDPLRSRVQRFDVHGRLIRSWKAPPDGSNPQPAAIVVAPDDSLFVSYTGSARIDKFSRDGALITSWNAQPGNSSNVQPISGVAANSEFVFTIGDMASEIGVWNQNGMHVLDFSDSLDILRAPLLGVTPDSELLVFDTASMRVYRFRIQVMQTGHQTARARARNPVSCNQSTDNGRTSCNFLSD